MANSEKFDQFTKKCSQAIAVGILCCLHLYYTNNDFAKFVKNIFQPKHKIESIKHHPQKEFDLQPLNNNHQDNQYTTSYPVPTYNIPPNINGSFNQTTPTQPEIMWEYVDCSFCNGTGKNPGKSYPPTYGNPQTKQWCNICNSYEVPHYHERCPSCMGQGKQRKRVY